MSFMESSLGKERVQVEARSRVGVAKAERS